jgi:hypothetical protein
MGRIRLSSLLFSTVCYHPPQNVLQVVVPSSGKKRATETKKNLIDTTSAIPSANPTATSADPDADRDAHRNAAPRAAKAANPDVVTVATAAAARVETVEGVMNEIVSGDVHPLVIARSQRRSDRRGGPVWGRHEWPLLN